MKVRLHHQFLRFRLDAAEVGSLLQGENVVVALSFRGATLSFGLSISAEREPLVSLAAGSTQVNLPSEWTSGWETSSTVGFQFEVDSGSGTPLTIVVEKDYPCAHTKEGKAIFGQPINMTPRE